jgi:hypothetical protein
MHENKGARPRERESVKRERETNKQKKRLKKTALQRKTKIQKLLLSLFFISTVSLSRAFAFFI